MTREELFKYIDMKIISYPNEGLLYISDIEDEIHKIFDDFESRTCGNCHYYTGKVCYYHEGWNDEVGVVHPSMDKDDGCNRFSCKDKEK